MEIHALVCFLVLYIIPVILSGVISYSYMKSGYESGHDLKIIDIVASIFVTFMPCINLVFVIDNVNEETLEKLNFTVLKGKKND
jgi:hypothetical protein